MSFPCGFSHCEICIHYPSISPASCQSYLLLIYFSVTHFVSLCLCVYFHFHLRDVRQGKTGPGMSFSYLSSPSSVPLLLLRLRLCRRLFSPFARLGSWLWLFLVRVICFAYYSRPSRLNAAPVGLCALLFLRFGTCNMQIFCCLLFSLLFCSRAQTIRSPSQQSDGTGPKVMCHPKPKTKCKL